MARLTRPCLHCGRLVTGATYCAACQTARWATQGRRRPPRPWYGPGWAKARAAHLRTHPACEACGTTVDLEVDHVTPRSMSGGLMTLCTPHHHAKTAADRRRQRGAA
jgi:5-methylcytosine-specific restriction endonuclease McrA